MHANIGMTIDRFLAEAVEISIVADLEPLRVRIVRVDPPDTTTRPTMVESIDLTLDDHEDLPFLAETTYMD